MGELKFAHVTGGNNFEFGMLNFELALDSGFDNLNNEF